MDEVAQLLQPRRPDAVDIAELVDTAEPPVGVAPRHDRSRGHRTEAGKDVELFHGCRVEIHQTRWCRGICRAAVTHRVAVGPGPALIELPIAGGSPGAAAMPDDDLLAVRDTSGHVQPQQICTVQRSTCGGERISDPGTRIHGHQSGLVDETDDADHDGLVGVGCGCTRCGSWPMKPSAPGADWPISPAMARRAPA